MKILDKVLTIVGLLLIVMAIIFPLLGKPVIHLLIISLEPHIAIIIGIAFLLFVPALKRVLE